MKTFKQLKESISIVNGKIEHKCVIDTNIINNLVKYAQQVSASFQPDLRILVNQIEDELNKFGLTLGDIDLDMPFEDEGEDDYIVYMNATNNPVRNIFLSLSWRTVQGQQYDLRPDGSKLNHDVHLTVNLIDPEDMEDLLDGRDDNDDVAFVHVGEDELNLNEESLDKSQEKKREEIVKGMKKNFKQFKDQYGDKAKDVMYATATKIALKEDEEISEGTWSLPKTHKDLHNLHKILKSPLHIKDAQHKLMNHLGDDELYDHLDELKSDYDKGDKGKHLTDVRWAVAHHMKRMGIPVPEHLKERAASKLSESSDPVDTIEFEIPALVRCFEYVREDIKEDVELHEFVEFLLKSYKDKQQPIKSDDYEDVVDNMDKEEKSEK